MISRKQHGSVVWIDMESPTHAEVRKVALEFGVDLFIADELLLPSVKSRAEFHPAYVYAIFHFPALRHSHTSLEQEIDFVVGKDFLITTHYDAIDPLHKFSKHVEVDTILNKTPDTEHAGHLFYAIMKRLYRAVEHEIDFVRQDMGSIEEHIFSGDEAPMVVAISRSARNLLNLRQTIEPHREMLRTLEEEGQSFFGNDFMPYLRAISNDYYRVHNHIMRHTETLHELRETNNSLLSTKQNETMKRFTILAFVTFPLSLFVTMVEINTPSNPIIHQPHAFWILLVGTIAAGACMFAYFRIKRWM